MPTLLNPPPAAGFMVKTPKVPEWAKEISQSPAHQNPSKAPPVPTKDLELSQDSTTSLEQYYEDSKNASFIDNISRRSLSSRSLEKRGPLYCKDGPCVDGSCCGPDSICGYGPDFCGKGCQSQCDATAMCGEYSENADMPCGMNLCCSQSGWCGTTEVFCHNADPINLSAPCQAGYGSCSIASTPSCAKGGGSTNGRTIGYYQSWNVRTRKCDTKTPKQLDTKGFTHLFYSFAFIDPTSFAVVPAHDDDPAQMREFTGLAKDGLKTWIAVGGFDFSNPETKTHHTWSDMVSTKANRAAFISSAREYMDEYGFTGIDLDWEYPGEPKRGGRKLEDTRNFAMLLREMRAAYGDQYGISLTLAPDYWYLRWFDAKAMEPFVDFFGFMAYDLHGFWDEDVKTLGKVVRGQADIREIGNNTVPLWFDGLDPKKINFGLAMYGRGYTVSDKSCNGLLCSFSGPSKKGECTDSDGVMSLGEIKNLIKNKGLKPNYLKDSLMKELTWDDQWIGYDDEETFKDKKAWADGQCFGGTMIWSIDFQGSSTSAEPVEQNSPGEIPKSLLNKKLPNCKSGESYDAIKDMGTFWYNSGAEQWADEYINSQPDHSNWAQNLYRELFPKKDHTKFSCQEPGAPCDHDLTCDDFNAIDKGGLWYLFQSMAAFHSFMSQLSIEFDQSIGITSDQIGTMRQLLGIKSGAPKAPLDLASILGAAFSIGSALATPAAAVGGPLAGISGVMYMVSATGDSGGSDDAVEATDTIRGLLAIVAKQGFANIKAIVASTFGKQGHKQTDIPEIMRVGGVKNPAVSVFGWGSWLRDHPLNNLDDVISKMKTNLDQALIWQMARQFRGAYVVVRDDLPVDKCTNPNNAWEADKKRCLDILAWYPKKVSQTLGGNKDMEALWTDWNMDKLGTLRNAVECWENNNGHIGKTGIREGSWASETPPPCFFAMPVLKGNYSDVSKGSIWMAGNFPGQEGQAGLLWPKSKCENGNKELHQNPFNSKSDYKCAEFDLTKDLIEHWNYLLEAPSCLRPEVDPAATSHLAGSAKNSSGDSSTSNVMSAPTPENNPSCASVVGDFLEETTIAEGTFSTTATSAEVPSRPSLPEALILPHQHEHDAGPQLFGNEAALFQPVSSLALHSAAAGFPELSYQDSLSQDLLAGMDGIDFDFLLDDTQLSGSFIPAAPVNAGSLIMGIPPTGQCAAPSTIQPEHGSSFDAQSMSIPHQRLSPSEGQLEPEATSSLPRFAARLPSMEPERPEQTPLHIHPANQVQRPRQVHCLRPWKIEASAYSKILDEAQELRPELPSSFKLPSHRALSRFLEGYFRGFAVHLPFIHIVTFSATDIGLELLLSLTAVGALYRFEAASGYQIYNAARHLISWRLKRRTQPALDRLTRDDRVTTDDAQSVPSTPTGPNTGTREPELHAQDKTVHLLQAMVVLMAMASWGDRELMGDALSMSSQVAMLAREMKIHESEKPTPPNQQRAEGIKLEERRRTLFAAFALLNLQSVAFDVPPLLLNREVAINLPGCASSWQAPNAEEWSALRDTYMPPRPFPEKIHMLLAGQSIHTVTALSSFGNYVLIHGLLQQVLLTRNASEDIQAAGNCILSRDFVKRMETALRVWQESWEATYESTTDPSSSKGPLGFNSTALLRLAYIRLNVGFGPDRRFLARDDAQRIAAAFSEPILAASDRSMHMNQAVLQCIHALSIPVRVGIAFVARTQTLNWSIQHAFCNLECAFLLTQWLKVLSEAVRESGLISLQPDERRLINLVTVLVQETELGDRLDADQHPAVQIESLATLTLVLWSKTFSGSHVFDIVRVIGDGLSISVHGSNKKDGD
ncbi:hypothetical protein CSIM01_04345 [Colletotrichum simmondsii]|uniref:chitinase n=1 Tax=Colletotrichum simmondsii TaxID=703756 RepID=A0A135SAB4_9PEZI|nr:hypothetical protein CSIM01_04345 [Colletotrichum simmondsii]